MNSIPINGIIFDYGGTIDSRGVHWSEVIWDGYRDAQVPVTKEQFRDSYVMAERELARVRHILPNDNFHDLLLKKMRIELQDLVDKGLLQGDIEPLAQQIAQYCYDAARSSIEEARPVLELLSQHYPMMLVSNFYGNVDSVLRDFDLRRYFKGVIESAVVGVRKPNPVIFKLGVDVLELPASEVLVIGDSLKKDILPAESIGCQVLWLKGKGWTEDEDAQTHPNTITSLSEVPTLVL
ncbi:MAG: HAD family hydrolase [Muribaculaceae bacterium]|nr:HAD family hydrolase [Muribaculaceae bacterium]